MYKDGPGLQYEYSYSYGGDTALRPSLSTILLFVLRCRRIMGGGRSSAGNGGWSVVVIGIVGPEHRDCRVTADAGTQGAQGADERRGRVPTMISVAEITGDCHQLGSQQAVSHLAVAYY